MAKELIGTMVDAMMAGICSLASEEGARVLTAETVVIAVTVVMAAVNKMGVAIWVRRETMPELIAMNIEMVAVIDI